MCAGEILIPATKIEALSTLSNWLPLTLTMKDAYKRFSGRKGLYPQGGYPVLWRRAWHEDAWVGWILRGCYFCSQAPQSWDSWEGGFQGRFLNSDWLKYPTTFWNI